MPYRRLDSFWRRLGQPLGVQQGGGLKYESPSYANAGGTGDRDTINDPPVIQGNVFADADVGCYLANVPTMRQQLVDGAQVNQPYPTNFTDPTGHWLKFVFANKVVITEIKFYFSAIVSQGTAKIQADPNYDGNWQDVSSEFNFGGTAVTETYEVSGILAQAYRFFGTGGLTRWATYYREVEFKIGNAL